MGPSGRVSATLGSTSSFCKETMAVLQRYAPMDRPPEPGSVTIKLTDVLADIKNKPEFYKEGHNLTDDEKRVISPQDIWEVSFINSLEQQVADALERAFVKVDRKHYMRFQLVEWFEKQEYLLAQKLGRPPTNAEKTADAEKNRNFQRYSLCYVLNFPSMIIFNQKNFRMHETRIRCFLDGAMELHPLRFPYFEVIKRNTELRKPGAGGM